MWRSTTEKVRKSLEYHDVQTQLKVVLLKDINTWIHTRSDWVSSLWGGLCGMEQKVRDLVRSILPAWVNTARPCDKCGMLYVSGGLEGDQPSDGTRTSFITDFIYSMANTLDASAARHKSSDRHCPRCYGEAAEVVRLQAWARDNASAAKECRDKCAGRPVRKVVKCKKRGK